jgi:hypothetical protein
MVRQGFVVAAFAIFAALFAPAATSQEPPGMLATARYLFVVRGEWLYQFDVDTLQLRQRVRLDAPAEPATPVAPVAPAATALTKPDAPPIPALPELEDGRSGGAGGRFGGRGGRGGNSGGNGKLSAAAIGAGLEWLASHQDEDGKWDCDAFMKHDRADSPISDGPGNAVHDVGVTGLALLAFLGDGSTLRAGPFRENIKKGVSWLRAQQQNNGLFGNNASHDFIYDHAIATYAMCEAYGLSNYQLLKQSAQNGINYLESHRNPYSVWRYQPRDNDNDTSVTSWCLLACQTGEFFGLEVNPNALKLGLTWLDQVTAPDGRAGYTKQGERSSRNPGDHSKRFPVEKGEALAAAGLFTRFFLGQDPEQVPVMKAAADLILKQPPRWDTEAGTIDHYYWYFGTYAMYQMGGNYWREWSKQIVPAVVAHQCGEGNAKGSWDPVGVWGESGGRVYSTALMVLTLEAYYRYSRLIR